MKRCYKFVLVFLGSMFMFPALSNAQCSYERQAELSRIASNVQFSYNYLATSDQIQFLVNITNLTNDVYLKDSNGTVISGLGERQLNYFGGSTIRYDIYSKDSNCFNELISTKYIKLPNYNHFATYDDCKKNPDFELCTLWANNADLSDEIFYEKLENNLKKTPTNINNESDHKNFFEQIKEEFINGHFTTIVIVSGTVLLLVIILVLKKVRK